MVDGLEYWGIDFNKEARNMLPDVEAAVYSGTSMMNALITETGRKVGVITTRGDEDVFLHERSAQKWKGYSYQDLLHHVTHHGNKPLVPRRLVKGVEGRDRHVQGWRSSRSTRTWRRKPWRSCWMRTSTAIAVCFLQSFVNPAHELKVDQIAERGHGASAAARCRSTFPTSSARS